MSKDLTESKTTLPANFEDIFSVANAADLSEGAGAGFSVVSIRGSRWRIKSGGEENLLTNPDGEPRTSLEAVIVKSNRQVSKIFYAKSYTEGDDAAPDCWSMDGVSPDAGVENPPSRNCATCPNNVWGSKITPAGKKTKACADSRRLAIVPFDDLENEVFGGPMLLRVPAASLAQLAEFATILSKKGHAYNAVAVRIGFDPDASFPKLTFKPIRVLTSEEKAIIAHHWNSEKTAVILSQAAEITPVTPAEPAAAAEPGQNELDFDELDKVVEATAPKATPKKKAAAKKAASKEDDMDFEDDIPTTKAAKGDGKDTIESPVDKSVEDEIDSILDGIGSF